MTLDMSDDMTNIATLRTNTAQAAQQALGAGLINQAQFNRMTDGGVSFKDIQLAKKLVAQLAGGEGGDANKGIADSLHSAVTSQNAAQGSVRSIYEGFKDGTSLEARKEVLQNLR